MDSVTASKIKAAIDIGTNTTLLLIAEVSEGSIKVLKEEQRIPRLGKGVDESKQLHSDSIQRVIAALKDYITIIQNDVNHIEEVKVTATSAVRDASNGQDFINLIKKETGLVVQLLSGNDEARGTFLGALSTIQLKEKHNYVVIDIGGGSTEVAIGNHSELIDFHSYDMGCVRYKERYLAGNPPSIDRIEACRAAIYDMYNERPFELYKDQLKAIAVAGTATSIAALHLDIQEYSAERVNNNQISLEHLKSIIETFSTKSYNELLELNPNILKGREDLLLTGLLILEGFMQTFDLEYLTISTGGIRHGVLLMDEKL